MHLILYTYQCAPPPHKTIILNIQYYDLQAQYSFSAMPLRILKLSFQPPVHLFCIYITSVSNLTFISFVATFFQFHHEETQISS